MSDRTPAKKTTAKAAPAKKTPVKQATAKKATAKKTTAKKTTAKGAPAKKAAKKPAPAKRTTAKAAPAKETRPAKKATAGKRARAAAAAPFSRHFKRAQTRARGILDDPEQIQQIAENASSTSVHRSGPFAAVLDDFKALIRLVVAYSRGHYRDIPVDQLVVVLAGLIYVVSPVDVIPDILPAGFVDDAFVIGWVLKTVHVELDAFRDWELGRTATSRSGAFRDH